MENSSTGSKGLRFYWFPSAPLGAPPPPSPPFPRGETPARSHESLSVEHQQLGTCWKNVGRMSRNLPAAKTRASAQSATAQRVRRLRPLRQGGLPVGCRPNAH